jgi:site-specific DNA-methyltransferase (adenine-specific)
MMNKLYLGDNLDILRKIKDESVDLICTDPPINTGHNYNIFLPDSANCIWTWDETAKDARADIKKKAVSCKTYKALYECLQIYDLMLRNSDSAMGAYLALMGLRLAEMHRILSKTGSMYLHCDPTVSHYLKCMMDAIFGVENYRNEIVWYYRSRSRASKKYRRMHDIVLFYTKTENYVFDTPKPVYENELFLRDTVKDVINKESDHIKDDKGKYKRIRTRADDAFLRDVWDDIGILSLMVAERLGYPTQKPSLLYTRMIETSSKDGDVVLDPFCGSGTTLDAAQALKRKWIGIDSSIIALDVTEHRLKDRYSLKPSEDYEIDGLPTNLKEVKELASQETKHNILSNWAATRLNLTPTNNADNNSDATLWSLRDKKRKDVRIIAEVKTEKPSPDQVHPLQEYIENDTADIVILITLEPVTSEMRKIADKIEKFKYKGLSFPRLQFWQITDKYFDDPESVYDELQLPGKLRFKPTKKGDRLFPDIQFDSDMK